MVIGRCDKCGKGGSEKSRKCKYEWEEEDRRKSIEIKWQEGKIIAKAHTYSIDDTVPILSAVVALNCLMLIKGWRLKKIEINAHHHMFKGRPFD